MKLSTVLKEMKRSLLVCFALCLFGFSSFAAEGDYCDTPIPAAQGDISCYPAGSGEYVYYSYTAEMDGALLVNAYSGEVAIYAECNTSAIKSSNSGSLKVEVKKNQKYIIEWYSSDGDSFDWTLTNRAAAAGEFCSKSIAADKGVNHCDASTAYNSVYFIYTAQNTGVIVVSDSDNNNSVEAFLGCDATTSRYNYSGELVFDVVKGQTYNIVWYNSYGDTFPWTISERAAIAGETCGSAVDIVAASDSFGIKTSIPNQWYKFTAKSNDIITLSDGDNYNTVTLYASCNESYLKYESSGELVFDVVAGATYYISWSNSDSISDWTFKRRATIAGEKCNTPINIAASGSVVFKNATIRPTQYYSFTASSDGLLIISDANSTNYVAVYKDCKEIYKYDYSGDLEVLVKKDSTYLIEWESDGGNFSWTIENRATLLGEICRNPIVIKAAGDIVYDYSAKLSSLYYSYTATQDGFLVLHEPDAICKVSVYDDCSSYYSLAEKFGDLTIAVIKGQTYIIKWDNLYNGNFTWSLTERAPIAGEVCSTPIVATAGNVNFNNAKLRPSQYFTYTATSDGVLILSDASGKNLVKILKDCDEYYDDYNYDGELKIVAKKDSTYLIKWEVRSSSIDKFIWSITNRAATVGEICSKPIEITTTGAITYDYSTKLNNQYYSYTATQDGFLKIKDTSADNYIRIYETCEDYYSLESCYDSLVIEITNGKNYIIEVENRVSKNFVWMIESRASVPGETCSSTIAITKTGKVELKDAKIRSTQYYTYKATTDGLLILSDGVGINDVYVYDACGGDLLGADGYGELKIAAKKDAVYYIKWSSYYKNDFVWTLDNRAEIAGEFCSNAVSVKKDVDLTFSSNNGLEEQYFSFTAEQDGVIAVGDGATHYANVSIFDNCGSDAIGENQLGELVVKAKKDQTYYIVWEAYDSLPFTWKLQNRELREGDFCNKPVLSETIKDVKCAGSRTGSVSVTVSGGTAPYYYRWATYGAESAVISSASAIIDMPSNVYFVTVTDSVGCSVIMPYEIDEPDAITITSNALEPTCEKMDGSISLNVTGGSKSYSYKWNIDSTESSISNVGAGFYSVTVTDTYGCTKSQAYGLNNPSAPVITLDNILVSRCSSNTGRVDVSVSGGAQPYTFKWNDNVATEDRTALAAGNYYLSVTDSKNCLSVTWAKVGASTYAQPQIALVTVSKSGKNLVVWQREKTDAIKYYTIYREGMNAHQYDSVGTVPYDSTSVFVDNDPKANPTIQAWRYKISATNHCGEESALSTEYKTMYLQASDRLGGGYNLLWENYEGAAYSTFIIYRQTENGITELQRVPTTVNRYTDIAPPVDVKAYFVAIDLPTSFDPKNDRLKSDSGPFSQSFSNMSEAGLVSIKAMDVKDMLAYPNPATDVLHVNFEENGASVSLYAANGDFVAQTSIRDNVAQFDVAQLSSGFYYLKIQSKSEVITKSITICK